MVIYAFNNKPERLNPLAKLMNAIKALLFFELPEFEIQATTAAIVHTTNSDVSAKSAMFIFVFIFEVIELISNKNVQTYTIQIARTLFALPFLVSTCPILHICVFYTSIALHNFFGL